MSRPRPLLTATRRSAKLSELEVGLEVSSAYLARKSLVIHSPDPRQNENVRMSDLDC